MRSISITGVLLASDSSKPCSTARTISRQMRPRIEQPHLRLHGEGVRALLHDARALAVVLAEDDERAALDARGREIRQRIGGHVRADGRLPGDRAAQRIVDGGGEHRGGGRLRGARLEVHAELAEDLLGVRQHVHQMRDRRALVAADVGDPGLQQRLGDGENALAAELRAFAEAQRLDFFRERALGHGLYYSQRQAGTSANTRSGLPEPLTIFSGGAITTAPVGGS